MTDANVVPWPEWKKVYNMHVVDHRGYIVTSTVRTPVNKELGTIVGQNVKDIFKPIITTAYMAKLRQTLQLGESQLLHYMIGFVGFVAVMDKMNENSVIVHEAKVTEENYKRVVRLLLGSSGHLYSDFFQEDVG